MSAGPGLKALRLGDKGLRLGPEPPCLCGGGFKAESV